MNRLGVENIEQCHISSVCCDVHEKLEKIFSPFENVYKLNELAEEFQKIGSVDSNKMCSFSELLDKTQNLHSIDDVMGFTKAYNENTHMQAQERTKPDCPLIGADGNIFNLMSIVARALKDNDMVNEAKEMCSEIINCQSYSEALGVLSNYINITDQNIEQETDIEIDDDPEYEMNM